MMTGRLAKPINLRSDENCHNADLPMPFDGCQISDTCGESQTLLFIVHEFSTAGSHSGLELLLGICGRIHLGFFVDNQSLQS